VNRRSPVDRIRLDWKFCGCWRTTWTSWTETYLVSCSSAEASCCLLCSLRGRLQS